MSTIKKVYLLHCGIGNVGSELVRQIVKQEKFIEKEFGVKFVYSGLFNTKWGVFKKDGLSTKDLSDLLLRLKTDSEKKSFHPSDSLSKISAPFIFIDTTASDKTVALIEHTLQKGGFVVMSNKKPITNTQNVFNRLHIIGRQRLFYETTVGAGLPVIQTLKTLLATGDEVIEIQGCMSGTLGFVFSQLENGKTFSEAILDAKAKGFTEPDPRDDLSGKDVARKALILTRILGQHSELSDIQLESLYPKAMVNLTQEAFLQQLPKLDKEYIEKVKSAKKANKVLRFVARINKDASRVGLETVDKNSEIGSLQGRNNLIMFQTKRYFDNPLTVKGNGAGGEVTAAGVLGDMLQIAKMI